MGDTGVWLEVGNLELGRGGQYGRGERADYWLSLWGALSWAFAMSLRLSNGIVKGGVNHHLEIECNEGMEEGFACVD